MLLKVMGERPLIIRRNVKYARIELKTGNLVIILPKKEKISEREFIERHKKWIKKKLAFIEDIKKEFKKASLIKRKEEEFYELVYNFLNEIKKKMNVNVRNVRFRYMKTKWGSFSKRGNVTVNILAKYLPENLIKYIIFHETVHSIIPDHSKKFWFIVEKEFPNYEELEKALLGYWFLLSERLTDLRKK